MWTLPTHAGFRPWIALALSILMLGALLLRLQAVWQRIPEPPDELALHMIGDESGYEALADALLRGSFFQSPVRVAVYPISIAGVYYALAERSLAKLLYVHAFVGVATIPLTYLLARCLTRVIPAVVAAGIVAFDDLLIDHARYIYVDLTGNVKEGLRVNAASTSTYVVWRSGSKRGRKFAMKR